MIKTEGQNQFTKEERLNSARQIEILFKEGKHEQFRNIRAVYLLSSEKGFEKPKILITVSKKLFKRATDRNYIKRHIREAYRTHKSELLSVTGSKGYRVIVALVYTGKSLSVFPETLKAVETVLRRVVKKIENAR